MANNKDSLTISVTGTPTEVDINPNQPLRVVIPKALAQTHNVGRPPEDWELRDEHGVLLDLDRKIETFGFAQSTVLFLSLRAGIGG